MVSSNQVKLRVLGWYKELISDFRDENMSSFRSEEVMDRLDYILRLSDKDYEERYDLTFTLSLAPDIKNE